MAKLENYAKDDELLRCDSCGFILEFNDVWDARINFDYPLDFSRQWKLWEKGKFGDTRMVYGKTPEGDYENLMLQLSLDRSLAEIKILEVGFGHGGILQRLQAHCPTAYGIDLVKPPSSAKLRKKTLSWEAYSIFRLNLRSLI